MIYEDVTFSNKIQYLKEGNLLTYALAIGYTPKEYYAHGKKNTCAMETSFTGSPNYHSNSCF